MDFGIESSLRIYRQSSVQYIHGNRHTGHSAGITICSLRYKITNRIYTFYIDGVRWSSSFLTVHFRITYTDGYLVSTIRYFHFPDTFGIDTIGATYITILHVNDGILNQVHSWQIPVSGIVSQIESGLTIGGQPAISPAFSTVTIRRTTIPDISCRNIIDRSGEVDLDRIKIRLRQLVWRDSEFTKGVIHFGHLFSSLAGKNTGKAQVIMGRITIEVNCRQCYRTQFCFRSSIEAVIARQ